MINKELEIEILRLFHAEKWHVGTISRQLGIHHSVVRRVLEQEGKVREKQRRPRLVDPYVPFIVETLEKYPKLTASRLYQMIKERGYTGSPSRFRGIVAELRPAQHVEAYLRLKTLPAEQAQVDWGHFGRLQCGAASRALMAYVMVLSYSRAIFVRFFLSQNLSSFLYGHQFAFEWFGGISRVCLYDNLKSVVLERIGNAIRFNPQFMEFAGHYKFQPRPVAVRRGNEKGRVERAIRYIRSNFFAARRFKDLEDLNQQALQWCESHALERRWPEDHRLTVGEVFLEEKKQLMPLPENPYPCDERAEVSIGKSPYARFDLNDYSVPHTLVQKFLVVRASFDIVRICDADQVVAVHQRCYDRARQIENPAHIEELRRAKTAAGEHRRTSILADAAPASSKLLEQLAKRSLPLARVTSELEELLYAYGACALDDAISEALANNAAHMHAVRHILERSRREQGKSPALPLSLPDDPRVKNLTIKPHSLTTYDNFLEQEDDEDSSS